MNELELVYKYIIYQSILSVLIVMILQSVIRCSGSPHLFSESKSPLSETDDVVHNVFINTQGMRNLWRHSYCIVQNLHQVLYLFQNEAYESYWLA